MHAGMNNNTTKTVVSALFVALTAVCSWISIPVPGTSVPINLATFAVLLTGIMLGSRQGMFAISVFLIIGAVGVPVFSGFTGGLGILLGPTGGFLIGYLAMAGIAGRYRGGKLPFAVICLVAEAALYAFGVIWFMISTGSGAAAAIAACVLPFIPGDCVKAVLVWIVSERLKRVI